MAKRRSSKKLKKASTNGTNDSADDVTTRNDISDTQLDEEETEEVIRKKRKTEPEKSKGKANKSKTSKNQSAVEEISDDNDEYEVESVLDERKIKKKLQYLIKWKGYSEKFNTWEPAETLNCDEAIAQYKAAKKDKKRGKSSKSHSSKANDDDSDDDKRTEYEVERILDVYFKKNGQREFLVLWKGFSKNDSTWEPEEEMDCKDLIESFMQKINKAKDVGERELRVKRIPTNRLCMGPPGTRKGKRNANKQR